MALQIPDPNAVFPNAYKTSCFLKNVVQAPNVTIGDYPYYDDPQDPTGFEKNNILFNYPEFGDRLTIGKFCCLASGTTFVMGAANHRLCRVTTYPFAVFGGAWEEHAPPHLAQLPRQGATVMGNAVWLGREAVVAGDGRTRGQIGKYVTWLPGKVTTLADFVAQLRQRDTRPAIWNGTGYDVVDTF